MWMIFSFNESATPEIYTLSLHDALPILIGPDLDAEPLNNLVERFQPAAVLGVDPAARSEEHTSELQSRRDLVCRLLLEKKKRSKRSTPRCLNVDEVCRRRVVYPPVRWCL